MSAPDGTPILGEDTILSVLDVTADPPAYVEVANMHDYSKTSQRASKKARVFNKVAPITSVSKTRDQTFTIDGFESPADPGQDILNAAEAAGTPVTIKCLVDGTNGFMQDVLVLSYKNASKADDGELRDLSYDFTAVGVATAVGTYTLL